MAKLVLEIEVQTYGESDVDVLTELSETLQRVIALCQISVGTFVKSEITDEDAP
jgi:hypothetical protein